MSELTEVWQMVSMIVAFVVLMVVIDLMDFPDWLRAYLKKGSTRLDLEQRIGALELQIEDLQQKISQLSK